MFTHSGTRCNFLLQILSSSVGEGSNYVPLWPKI